VENVKNVVLIGGYSRSGKTSFLSELVKNGVEVASTSWYLDLVCSSLLMHGTTGPEISKDWAKLYEDFLLGKVKKDASLVGTLQKKDDKALAQFSLGLSCRGFKIHIAENVIVPSQGRYVGLVLPTLAHVAPDKEDYVVETLGGEEGEMFESALGEAAIVLKANIRSSQEEKGNDIRKLFPIRCDKQASFWFDASTWYHPSIQTRLRTRFNLLSEFFSWWEGSTSP
jgi:hypothetical protein